MICYYIDDYRSRNNSFVVQTYTTADELYYRISTLYCTDNLF